MTLTTADLLRASALVAGSAVLLAVLLRVLQLRSARLRRLGWSLVLLQGVMLAPWSLSIPWYDPPARGDAYTAELPELRPLASAAGGLAVTDSPSSFTAEREPAWTWSGLLLEIWAAGALLILGAMGATYLLLLREARRTQPAPESWQREMDETLRECGVRRRLPLRLHRSMGPLLARLPWGAMVIVPDQRWAALSREERCAVLRHEILHWRRGDVWKSLLARLLVIPHWFNPAAWWAACRFEQCAEWACDEQLAREAPQQAPVLARALLHFTEPSENSPLAAAANGAPLCQRLRRLLQPPLSKDSVMKRGMMLSVLAVLAVLGAIRVKLVARDDGQPAPPESRVDADFAQQVETLAKQLPADGQLGQLRAALATQEGRLVIRGRADHYVHEAQQEAQDHALPGFMDKHFEKSGEGYRLRTGQEPFRDALVTRSEEFNQDIEKVAVALKQVSQRIEADSEAGKLLVRFMNEDAGPVMLYIQELRNRIRPTVAVIEYRLRDLLTRNDQGKYIIREGRRPQAEQLVERAEQVLELQKVIHRELSAWTEDMALVDDLHKSVKQAFNDPLFALVISHKTMDDSEKKIVKSQLVNKLMDGIDDATKDVAEGLVLRDEARQQVEDLMEKYRQAKAGVVAIKPLLAEFASNVDDKDPLHKRWAAALLTDLIAVKVGEEIGEQGPIKITDAIQDLLGEVIVDAGNGRYRVAEGREEELTNHIQDAFRDYRKNSRRLRRLDEVAEQLEDEQLKQVFSSIGGKFTVALTIQRHVKAQRIDGLARWTADHLQRTESGGFRLTESGQEEVASMLREVEQVREELKNDDF